MQVTAVADAAAALADAAPSEPIDCVVARPRGRRPGRRLLAAADGRRDGVIARLPVDRLRRRADGATPTAAWRRLGRRLHRPHARTRRSGCSTWPPFFLHRPLAKLPEAQRQRLLDLHQSDKILAGKKVLIVDDDMRNIFALSTVLEEHDMVIVSADNGRDAIRILQDEPDIDIVLMDIMMPEMDGMETMREIRKIPQLKNLPIVAVTAKAMKGDREKCIEAGAWDYLSKPVDTEQLLAVLRAWLHR